MRQKSLTLFPPVSILRSLMYRAQVDSAVIYGVLSRIWGLGAGVINLLFIALYFSPEVQGYYYTFWGLLALQVFVELGLSQVVIQFASHEWSQLGLDEGGRIVGNVRALSRLVSLAKVTFRWYIVAGGIIGIGLGFAGYFFFSKSSLPGIDWVAPWFVLCALTGINLCLLPILSLLEGCNQVSHIYAFRLIQGILMSLSMWISMILGAELWVASVSMTTGLIWTIIFLRLKFWKYIKTLITTSIFEKIKWRFEVWPMQWRIALSWASGYFIFSIFTPILFHYQGAVVAGQMGMTWNLCNGLISIASVWVLTKVPRFAILIAKKEYTVLDRLWFRSAIVSFIVAFCGAIVIWMIIYIFYTFNYKLSTRLLPPLPAGFFLLATAVMSISLSQAVYLRAHKKEPFLVLSLVQGVLTGSSTWLLGSRFGATGMAAGYLAVVALVVMPMGTIIWYRRRAAWHAPMGEPATLTGITDR